jgi:hypothetical protein
MQFQNQTFAARHRKSEEETLDLMKCLVNSGIIKEYIKTEKEEDIAGTDFHILIDEEAGMVPIQFKTRKERWRDFPVCRFQPFRGFNNSTVGRDYRSLAGGKNKYYIVASSGNGKDFDRVTITETKKIYDLIVTAEKEWFGEEVPWQYFSEEIYNRTVANKTFNKKLKIAENGVEAWFKKNPNNVEAFGKINLYIPSTYADKEFIIQL